MGMDVDSDDALDTFNPVIVDFYRDIGFLPDAVIKCVIHALESSRPKPRYYITVPTVIFGFFKRFVSTALLDYVLLKISKSER